MELILILIIPVIVALTGYITLKAVQLGLTWKIQAENKETPTAPIQAPRKVDDISQYSKEQINEWMFGGGK